MKVSTKEILVLDGRPLASVKSFAVITYKYISTYAYADAQNRTLANELHRLLNSWKLNSARQTSIEKDCRQDKFVMLDDTQSIT